MVELLPKVCRLVLTSNNDEIPPEQRESLGLVLHTQPSDTEHRKYDRWHQTSSNCQWFYGGEGERYQVPGYAHQWSFYMAKQCQLLSPKLKLFYFILFYCFARLVIHLLFIAFTKALTIHFKPVHAAVLTKQTLTCFHVSNWICLVFVLVFNLQAHSILTRRPLE